MGYPGAQAKFRHRKTGETVEALLAITSMTISCDPFDLSSPLIVREWDFLVFEPDGNRRAVDPREFMLAYDPCDDKGRILFKHVSRVLSLK